MGVLQWSYSSDSFWGGFGSSPCIGSEGTIILSSLDNILYAMNSTGSLGWSYFLGLESAKDSSPSIGSDEKLVIGYGRCVYCFHAPTAIPTQTPTATPPPNYINLDASPDSVRPGESVTLEWHCDFTQWDYRGVPVNMYLAAIKNPKVINGPSSVSDALTGGTVYLYGRNMQSAYIYTGIVREPTFSGVAFPPVSTTGSLTINVPICSHYVGDYVFATALVRCDTHQYVRDDGLPVENSGLVKVAIGSVAKL
jgi:outer membrane protein assembly factor BamB